MLKKIAVCLAIIFLMPGMPGGVILGDALGDAHFAEARETINGIGVGPARTPLLRIAAVFTREARIGVTAEEAGAGITVRTIGGGVGGYNFGMLVRPLNDTERAAFPDVKAFQFARDGVSIIVHPDNPVRGLTTAQIRDIYAGRITDWAAVGGKKGPITLLIRETGSGTRVAVEAAMMGADKVAEGKARAIGSTSAMRDAVAADESAIGYVGFGAVDRSVKALEVDGRAPTVANVIAGAYPIAMPLYVITRGDPTGATKKFVDFLLGPRGQEVVKRERLASPR